MKYAKSFTKRTIISIILFFLLFYFLNNDNKLVKNIVFDNRINFAYFKRSTKILFGNILSKKILPVNNNVFTYHELYKIDNVYHFEVDENTVIYSFCDGIISEIKKNSININCDVGYDINISNIKLRELNVYDNIDKNALLGEAYDNYIELTIKKDDKYLNYEEIY